MRGHRLLFVLAAFVALGLVGFANFPGDRDAVADIEASQLVGGTCDTIYWTINCGGTCVGNGQCDPSNGPNSADDTRGNACGGSSTDQLNCGKVYSGCTQG